MILQGFGKGGARKPVIESEGVFVSVNGQYRKSTSKTKIEVLDLLGEGPMQGIVSGYHRMHGGYIGRTGWASAEFIAYNDGLLSGTNTNSGILRSVFYNDVPILDDSNRYNFSNIQFKFVNGGPMGATGIGAESIFDDELTITRNIGEQLLGPNYSFSDDGKPTDVLVAGDERFDQYRGNWQKLYDRDINAAIINRKVYRYYDRNLVGFDINVRITSLYYQEIENEDRYGDNLSYFFDYVIYARPIFKGKDKSDLFAFEKEKHVSLKGKVASSPFLNSTRIDVDDLSDQPDFLAWEIEIIRKTADSIHPAVSCKADVDSITQVYSQSFRYPNSAMASNLFDAEFFSQVPETTYEVDMLKIKVPDNYDTIARSYDGDWDGTFATEKKWSNNPAWVFYDVLTNKRYGVGDYIDEDFVDKWSLYEIGQYCDQLVRDGYSYYESPTSGLEPRFEANVYLATQDDAYNVINDLASIFRGMTYYIGGTIDVSQDAPKEPRFIFTNSNVVDGNFIYSSSSRKSRHTVALVRYNDKLDFFKPSVEYIEDPEGIRKYGIIQKDVTAIGCSSRGQAFRLGKWVLTTERLETETVSFRAGLEANHLRPGDVIKIFDENKTKKRYSGRTLRTKVYAYPNESGAEILLDRKVPLHNYETYKFSLATPTYSYESPLIDKSTSFTSADISGLKRGTIQEIYFTGGPTTILEENGLTKMLFTGDSYTGIGMNQFDTGSYDVFNNLIFAIEHSGNLADNCEAELYKAIKIEEKEPAVYDIFAMQHNSGKYDIIETGLAFESSVLAKPIGAPTIYNIRPADEDCTLYFDIKKGDNTRFIVMYVRSDGVKFDQSSRPDISLKHSVVPVSEDKSIIEMVYRMQGDNFQYDFAFWGTDGINFSSNGSTFSQYNNGNVLKQNSCEPTVCNFTVYSLRGDCVDNAAATIDSFSYETTEPRFKWNVDFDTIFTIDENTFGKYVTRVRTYPYNSVQVDSLGNLITTQQFYTEDRLNFSLNGETQFNMNDNIFGYNYDGESVRTEIGPHRNYDLVVDILDTTTNRASSDNNCTDGFDVLQVTNELPDPIDIKDYLTSYRFEPKLASQKMIINMSNYDFANNPDVVGVLLYYKGGSDGFTSITEAETDTNIKYVYSFFDTKAAASQIVLLPASQGVSRFGLVALDKFDQKAIETLSNYGGGNFFTSLGVSYEESYMRKKIAIAERLTTIRTIQYINQSTIKIDGTETFQSII